MYLAPLNYDRFFKKVFSDIAISKRFLEDFFDTTIETIELLPNKHKITDDSTAVEFDFRCKIKGQYILVDMQQWYKTDVVKRFFLYHSLNTALQVKELPAKNVQSDQKRKRETPDYHYLQPVVTLIWMADDKIGFTDDYVAYILTPEILSEFVKDAKLWQPKKFIELMNKREEILKVMNNTTKELDFLGQNKLIYALQKNIVENKKKYGKYVKWFEFAEKTKNTENERSDFSEYEKDTVFREIMRKLNKEDLGSDDLQYIEDYEKFQAQFLQHENTIKEIGKKEGEKIGIEKGEKIGIEKGKYEQQLISAEKCLVKGLSPEDAAEISELPFSVVEALAKRLGL